MKNKNYKEKGTPTDYDIERSMALESLQLQPLSDEELLNNAIEQIKAEQHYYAKMNGYLTDASQYLNEPAMDKQLGPLTDSDKSRMQALGQHPIPIGIGSGMIAPQAINYYDGLPMMKGDPLNNRMMKLDGMIKNMNVRDVLNEPTLNGANYMVKSNGDKMMKGAESIKDAKMMQNIKKLYSSGSETIKDFGRLGALTGRALPVVAGIAQIPENMDRRSELYNRWLASHQEEAIRNHMTRSQLEAPTTLRNYITSASLGVQGAIEGTANLATLGGFDYLKYNKMPDWVKDVQTVLPQKGAETQADINRYE